MENLKVIKNRIKTVDSIIKATNAMKMVSTVKLAEVNNVNKFAKECAEILFDMFSQAARESIFEQENDYWFSKKDGKTLIIVLSTDQGFCGSFKQFIQDKADETIKNNPEAYIQVFGKKGANIKQNRIEDISQREIESRYDIDAFASMLSQLVSKYIHDYSVNKVLVISGEFKNVLVQRAKCSKIFPIPNEDITKTRYTSIEGNRLDFIEAVFEKYLSKVFISIVTEHLVSELSARVMAMDNSVRNANDMFEKLNSLYNRVRQDKITQELTEIVSSIECVQ